MKTLLVALGLIISSAALAQDATLTNTLSQEEIQAAFTQNTLLSRQNFLNPQETLNTQAGVYSVCYGRLNPNGTIEQVCWPE